MYKDLKIWQSSMDLVSDVYKFVELLPKTEEYNLKTQIKRAIVSVPLNIAEGKMRASSKEFAHFLNIATASLIEVEVGLEISSRLGYISIPDELSIKIKTLNKMINSLRTKLLRGGSHE